MPINHPEQARRDKGRMSFEAGLSAEQSIRAAYQKRGHLIETERWRGTAGEIDLIVRNAEALIFVEVKQSKTFEAALSHLSQAQIARLYATAEEYLAHAGLDSLTDIRFDVALVNQRGEYRIVENAFA